MENDDKLKEVVFKNRTYYFDDVTRVKDINFNNILLDKKPHENIKIYDISYKHFIGGKPLLNRFDKADGFIKDCEGNRQ